MQTATYTRWAGKISPRRWHWSGDLNDREGQVLPSILDTKEQFVLKPQALHVERIESRPLYLPVLFSFSP